jgi:hypothetical protein
MECILITKSKFKFMIIYLASLWNVKFQRVCEKKIKIIIKKWMFWKGIWAIVVKVKAMVKLSLLHIFIFV